MTRFETPPRSLMVIHQFRPVMAGAELQAERLAGKLAELGHPVRILTQHRVEGTAEHEIINGVPVHRVSFPLAHEFSCGLASTFEYFFKHRHEYDILHSHLAYGHAVAAVVAAKLLGKKTIVKVAGAGSTGEMATTTRFRMRSWGHKALYNTDAIVAVSTFLRDELIRYGFPAPFIRVIPNGVDTDLFRRKRPQRQDAPIVFMALGRRGLEKGIDVILKALRILLDRGVRGMRVDHYGFDAPECDYRELAEELHVTQAFQFLPFSENVIELMQDAHAFLLPSRNEGLSNALLEAMACELPVVATAISGTVDVVNDGVNGLLIPPDDPEALAAAMQKVIEGSELRSSLASLARKRVVQDFSLDSVGRRYSELYYEITQRTSDDHRRGTYAAG